MPFDIQILLDLEQIRNPIFTKIFLLMTQFGEELILLPLMCLVYWCFNKRLACFAALNFFSALLVNHVLKITFCVNRPWIRNTQLSPVPDALDSATGFSFPSGHTANAVSIYGSVLLWFRKHIWIVILNGCFILLIAFSRLYLGVHTLQDVAISLIAGFILLFFNQWIFKRIEKNPERDRLYLGLIFALAVLCALYTILKPYPDGTQDALKADGMKTLGAMVGTVCGVYWDFRKIRFSKSEKPWINMVRFIIGLAVLLFLKPMLKSPLNQYFGLLLGSFIRYFILLFWIFGLYPFLFTLLNPARRNLNE